VSAAWDSRADFPIYSASYRYEGLYPSVRLSRVQDNKYLGLIARSNRVATSALELDFPIGHAYVGFGGTIEQSNFLDEESTSGGLQARFGYDDLSAWGDRGRSFAIAFTGYITGRDPFSSIEANLDQRVPLGGKHYLRLRADGGHSSNALISALYFVGGGEESVTAASRYLLRGYAPGAIFGRDLATASLEYVPPLAEVNRGPASLPAFYERARLKLAIDTGSGEFVADRRDRFRTWPVGVSAHLLQDLRILYRFPFTVGLGFDWGLSDRLGGQKQFVFGVFARLP
jgi:hemolysin activation/secretion protein